MRFSPGYAILLGLMLAAPAQAQEKLSGNWRVERLEGKAPLAASPITLQFADGRVAGRASCNRYGASVTSDGDNIAFGAPMTTRMACQPPVMEQERRFLAFLARATQWTRMGDKLTIRTADGASLHAVPADL